MSFLSELLGRMRRGSIPRDEAADLAQSTLRALDRQPDLRMKTPLRDIAELNMFARKPFDEWDQSNR